MHLIMFDIDGTLVESYDFDSVCFSQAVHDVLDISVDTDWDRYEHVTDSGILKQVIDESVGMSHSESIVNLVKQSFVYHLTQHIEKNEIRQIAGASLFLKYLRNRSDVTVSFATGGWLESAQLKLTASGIDSSDIPIASSSDHHSRTEIMKISEQLTRHGVFQSKTYFGDGVWDLQASELLGFKFVLVGTRVEWKPSIENYSNIPEIMKHIDW